MQKPVMLMILDGWGYNPDTHDNAVYTAKTPNLDRFVKEYPGTFLKCSGIDVGLPRGFMGNSEVGHLNIGAGRIVYQDLTKIDKAIEDGDFFENKELLKAFEKAKENNSKLHVMGLLSDGGVHSHINHLEAIIKLAKNINFKNLVVHPIFDGRDTAPKIGHTYLKTLFDFFEKYGLGSLGSMSGRYYAMDRDKRWDRVQRAYNAMVLGTPFSSVDPISYILDDHKRGIGDEFIEPACFNKNNVISDNDAVIFFNFRSDRAREITTTLMAPEFKGFERTKFPKISYFVCLTEYDENFKLPVAFSKQNLNNILGEVIFKNGLKQLRIAETEKYAHVTFFFNGGREEAFPGEDRALIESPRSVSTYDLKPEMSAYGVTDRVIKEIERDYYDLIVLNYANCDMVGHTGVFDAAVKAVETIDACAGKVVSRILEKKGVVFLTADHGNAEKMKENGTPHTAHTTDDVRFIAISEELKNKNIKLRPGRLSDIMPTILDYMNIKIPQEVTGEDLIIRN